MWSNIFDKVSFGSLFLLSFLLPLFVLPFTGIPIETSKGLLLVISLVACVIAAAMARFSDGKIVILRSPLLLSGAGIVLAFLLSAFFSENLQVSFFGIIFDSGTFWFVFCAVFLMFLSALVFRNVNQARFVLVATVISAAAVLVFQGFRLFLPDILSLGVLGGKTGNLLGSWNAFGLFAGFTVLAALLLLEFFSVSKKSRWLLTALIVLGLLMMVIVNFIFVWELVGVFALIIFVYKVSFVSNFTPRADSNSDVLPQEREERTVFPVLSFLVVLIALLFFTSGNFLTVLLPERLTIVNTEVSPSLSATISVTRSVLRDHPILGIGPNRFSEAWALYKPMAVNSTQFWDVSFNSGSGLLPTLASTTGALGIISLLLFFILFLITSVRRLFSGLKSGLNFEMVAFFLLALYLFIAAFFYSTGVVLFFFAFLFTGVFLGLSARTRPNSEIVIPFLSDHRKSFFSILLLVCVMILSAAFSFKYIERFASVPYYGRALAAPDVAEAEAAISRALSLNQNDLYLRTYAQVYLLKLNSLVSKNSSLSEEEKVQLQASFDQAVNAARLATSYNGKNYLNWQMLGSVFQTAGSVGVKDAYARALEAYKTASSLNPLNPGLKLTLANVSLSSGNTKAAKSYTNEALDLKSDYVAALITLSQILKNEGDLKGALSYAQSALAVTPANKDLIRYVESLRNSSVPVSNPEVKKP